MRSRRSARPEPGDDATALLPQRSDVGFVFQHYAPFKHLSIWDNVAFGLKVRKTAKPEMRERVSELLELVHLEKFAARYPAQPSGGQRQRMVLARSLAVQPRVLQLDEPFGALDAQVRAELRDWLRRLHDQIHETTVIVTHDQKKLWKSPTRSSFCATAPSNKAGRPHDRAPSAACADVAKRFGPTAA